MSTTNPVLSERPFTPAPKEPAGQVARPHKLAHRHMGRRLTVGVAILVTMLPLLLAGWALLGSMDGSEQPLIYYSVTRSDLPIIVTERGNLESQRKTTIRNEVENQGSSRGGSGETQILFIVPNGQAVKEGDLLVELDSAPIRDRLDTQVLAHEKAAADRVTATSKHKNQGTQNETNIAKASLTVELAKLLLNKYKDKDMGDYKLLRDKVMGDIEDANNKILESQANMELKKTERDGFDTLFKLGYRGKAELDQKHYSFLTSQNSLTAATNRLETLIATSQQLSDFDQKMQLLTLNGGVDTAKRDLIQTGENNKALLAQAEAARLKAVRSEAKEMERLNKLKDQLKKCEIYAPHDGMVVYASMDRRRGGTPIAEGTTVRQRQRILTLPNLSRMQVKTTVHESVLNQVYTGQSVIVRMDAFPDRTYRGTVTSVAVLPDRGGWGSNDIKVYETIITIDEEVEDLKPGMTAVVEIHVDRLRDVLSVPVQAVMQIGRDNWCYVDTAGKVERRVIRLGQTNDKFVHIKEGLSDGDRVVLNPMSILDEAQRAEPEISPDDGSEDIVAERSGEEGQSNTTVAGDAARPQGEEAQGRGPAGSNQARQEAMRRRRRGGDKSQDQLPKDSP